MLRPDPIGLPGLAACAVGAFAFVIAVIAARRPRDDEAGATRPRASMAGIALQGVGFAVAGAGPQRVTLDPLSAPAIAQAAAVFVLMTGAVALFTWSTRTMGRNWSIVARTRADHQLVQTGPFAWVRHPIYAGMALFLLALAVAFGHTRQLLFALPVFVLGTGLRVRSEEALLRDRFGPAYDAYAARVRRFVPGLF